MGFGSNGKLGEKCKKTDSNEYTCKFPNKKGENKATVKVRASKDGELEIMERDFEPDVDESQRDELIERTTKHVKVKSNKSAGGKNPFEGPSE